MAEDNSSPDEDSIWHHILNDYMPSKADKKETTVLVLGHTGCGVRSLVARLRGHDPADATKGFALEYESLNINIEGDEDLVGLVNFWHIEGPQYSELLPLVLIPERLPSTVVVIAVDLTMPHSMMSCIEEWYAKLEEALAHVYQANPQLAAELRQKALQYLAQVQLQRLSSGTDRKAQPMTFAESEASSLGGVEETTAKPQRKEATLGPGMLINNLGIPVILVGTKADQVEAVVTRDSAALLWGQPSSSQPTVQIMNFMQLYLRKWCLANGAALIYTSSLTNLNTGLLLNYILHRAYGLAMPNEPAGLLKPDVVFIPWGFDSLADIAQLPVDMITDSPMEVSYSLVIRCPPARQELDQPNQVQSMEHQAFLVKQLQMLQQKGKDGEPLRLQPTLSTSKPTAGSMAFKKATKELLSPKSGKRVEQDAERFFASMLRSYKK